MNQHIQRISRTLLMVLVGLQIAHPVMADEVTLPLLRQASAGLYIHTVLGSGIESDMLLDTGSSYVVLSDATFDAVKDSTDLTFSRQIFGAMANGGVEEVSLYILSELKLSDNCILRNIEVAILPNANKDILGLNALEFLQPFTLQMTPAILSSQSCST